MLSSVDLSCVEAIARHGELAAAARELKRDPSTLFRWLKALETRLGASLFSRTRGRYVPSQRNSAGYGGLLLGISDSFLHKDQVSAKTGQLQVFSNEV
jgi:molybdenum-dependent DNA-binding transcriptional regulator ModE